jgi:hypothetical protein
VIYPRSAGFVAGRPSLTYAVSMQLQPPFARPFYLLRAEALCVLLAACSAYHLLFPHHWVLFACLFLVPDLSLLAYAGAPHRWASTTYNAVHNYVLPGLLVVLFLASHRVLLGQIGVIWIAHIGMDRMLGFGLKYPASFQFTHLQSANKPSIVDVAPANQG